MCDFQLKIVMVGEMGVGKSALFRRFFKDRSPKKYIPTVLANSDVRVIKVNGKPGLLDLWDASGTRIHYALLRRLYLDADGFLIVYDTTSLTSFSNVGFWLKELVDFGPKEANIMLVGTKCDEKEKREVTQQMAYNYAEQHGLSFMESSAKSGDYVKDVFYNLIAEVYDRLGLCSEETDNGDHQQDGQDKADKEQSNGDGDGDGDGDGGAVGEGVGVGFGVGVGDGDGAGVGDGDGAGVGFGVGSGGANGDGNGDGAGNDDDDSA